MAEAGTQHLAHRLFLIRTGLSKGLGQFVGLVSGAAPERKLPKAIEQRGDEHLFLVTADHVAGDVARLHGGMEGARQQLLQLLTRGTGQQAVDQAEGQADEANVLESHQHDGAGDRTNRLLGGVVVGAVTDPKDLGGQRGIAQQHVGQLLDGRVIALGEAVAVEHDRRESRQIRLSEPVDP